MFVLLCGVHVACVWCGVQRCLLPSLVVKCLPRKVLRSSGEGTLIRGTTSLSLSSEFREEFEKDLKSEKEKRGNGKKEQKIGREKNGFKEKEQL